MKKFFLLLIVLLGFLTQLKSLGQVVEPDTTILYRIETNDGNEYLGNILQRDSIALRVKTLNVGVIAFKWKDISKIVEVKKEELRNGVDWYQVLQSTRYFWSPNGYGLRKGESYYQNIWVLYNQFSTGIINNFSIGLGLLPLFLFAGTATPIWIVPKLSIPVIPDKLNLGVGALSGIVAGVNSSGFGIVYGIATLGTHDNNVTFGLGYGYADKSWSERPLITLSGMLRAGKKSYLMTENFFFNFGSSNLIISVIGGRSLIRKSGLDYGLAIPIYKELDSFIAIPWLGLTIPIEAKNH